MSEEEFLFFQKCDDIDSYVFSSDVLSDVGTRQKFLRLLDRWKRRTEQEVKSDR